MLFQAFEIEDRVLTWMSGEIDIASEDLYVRSFEYEIAA